MRSYVHHNPAGLLVRGIGLLATMCAIASYAPRALAQTVTQIVFATNIDAPVGNDWANESEAEGDPGCTACDCDSNTAPFATQATAGNDWLTASSIGNFTSIPSNYTISSVRVDFMCRYGLNTNGRISWDYQVPGQRSFTSAGIVSPTFTSSSGNCSYRLGSRGEIVNELGRPWTRADLDAMQLRMRRCQDNCNSTTLRARAFRITVTAEPPIDPNDSCAGAIAIGVGTTSVTFDGVGENIDGSASCQAFENEDLWYSFTPPTSGAFQVDTCQSDIDTVLSIVSACGGSELACDDDDINGSCNDSVSSSSLTVQLSGGVRYLIRVGSYEVGAVQLRVTPIDPNDSCAGAIAIGVGTTSVTFDGVGENIDGSASCQAFENEDLWYSFTPPTSGAFQVDTCQSDIDTVLSIVSACGGSELACDDDDINGSCNDSVSSSSLTVQLSGGVRYLIRVGSYEVGAVQLRVAPIVRDPNDSCAGAIAIGVGTTPVIFDGVGENVDGSASCQAFETDDLWYRFTPPVSAAFQIDSCQAELDTVLSVYAGCGTVELACADDVCGIDGEASLVVVPLLAQNSYLIRVGSYSLGTTMLKVRLAGMCDSLDFNNNGLFPEDQDLIDFLSVFAGGNCSTGDCNDIDFNNNGLFPEDQDLIDFLNVLAGGDCL